MRANTSLVVETLVVGQLQTNCYLVVESTRNEAIIIDPGDDAEYIIDHLKKMKAAPLMILATHGHFDHILAARALQLAFHLPFLIHELDRFLVGQMRESARHFLGLLQVDPPPEITRTLRDGQNITIGSIHLMVLHTPGHTPGSVCLSAKGQNTVFVGDTVFAFGAVGRTDFSYANPTELSESLKKILTLPGKTVLYPGHGQETTVSDERAYHKV